MKNIHAAFLLLAALAVSAHCRAGEWGVFWDAVAQRPDAKTIDHPNINGAERRRIVLNSGVEFQLDRRGDQLTSVGHDKSGKGAVLCLWEVYIATKIYVETCSPTRDQELEADLDRAIDQINDFIVENSLQPTSKADLVAAIEQRKKIFKGTLSPGDDRKCPTEAIAPLAAALKLLSSENRQAAVTKLLSIKRPRVMNPCL